ncbi:MAG: trypsin-like peptidase domain-containing protein [Chloroflexi bacterium]|nr:trypsin-like peptidase domain-containing protein [Chloroflexota bacterium]
MDSMTKKMTLRGALLAVLLAFTLFGCGIFTPDAPAEAPRLPDLPVELAPEAQSEPAVAPVAPLPAVVSESDQLLVELYRRVNPAVVNVTIYGKGDGSIVPADQVLPLSQGSGFVYDQEGHIVTNAHVVHGADEVEVTFSDGLTKAAQVVGEDLNSDLAVLKVEGMPEGVTALPLGNMETLAVGQTVLAIGNPFGLEGTLTRGIISALGRTIPALTPFSIPQSIQTDAAINPGNSGGPLLNLSGEVIGVNAQIETGGTGDSNLGVGFAIPVSIVRLVAPDLIANGEHEWAWLGVRGGNVTPLLVEAMKLPVEKGAYLAEVLSGGPSAKAGLRGANDETTLRGRAVNTGGDVIIAVDGQPVSTFDDILIYIALQVRPGQEVTLTIVREGETMDVNVRLEKRPASLDN